MISDAGGIKPSESVSATNAAVGDINSIGERTSMLTYLAHQAIKEETQARILSSKADLNSAVAGIDSDPNLLALQKSDPGAWMAQRTQRVQAASDRVLAQFGGSPSAKEVAASELKGYISQDQVEQAKTATAITTQNAADTTELAIKKNLMASVNGKTPLEQNGFLQAAQQVIQMGPWPAGEKEQRAHDLIQQHDLLSQQKFAQDNPAAMLLHLNDPNYSDAHPWVTPEQHKALEGMARTQLTVSATAIEDARKLDWANTFNQIKSDGLNGRNIDGEVQAAVFQRRIPKEWGEALVHHPIEYGSDPHALASIDSDIKQVSTPLDIAMAKDKIRTMMMPDADGMPLISRTEGMKRLDALDVSGKKLDQDTKGYEARSMNILRTTYGGSSIMTRVKSPSMLDLQGKMPFDVVLDEFRDNYQQQVNKGVSGWPAYQNAIDATNDRFLKAAVNGGGLKDQLRNQLNKTVPNGYVPNAFSTPTSMAVPTPRPAEPTPAPPVVGGTGESAVVPPPPPATAAPEPVAEPAARSGAE